MKSQSSRSSPIAPASWDRIPGFGSADARPTASSSFHFDGWNVREFEELGSTNDAAAAAPDWTALRADRQTAGRGRHQRSWVSDAGGLWLSAVVPTGPPNQGWPALPLAAGVAVCQALSTTGLSGLRLRWPNDVMIGGRKLAGLLVEQFRPGHAVVGLGINVGNCPGEADPLLSQAATRLADLTPNPPTIRQLAVQVLGRLREVVEAMAREGFAGVVPLVNDWWPADVHLEIETDAGSCEGAFLGVDFTGRLRLRLPDGCVREWTAHQVRRAREITQSRT